MDLVASIQFVAWEVVLRLARTVHRETGARNLCLAGGVALSCVANGRPLREGPVDNIWVQPAAGDAGGARGAAMSIWYEYRGNERSTDGHDSMAGAYLGPRCSDEDIRAYLDSVDAVYEHLDEPSLIARNATVLTQENVVGWFQDRMEFGPRALGGRSMIGDPRSLTMQSVMYLKIKYRESFRPVAPSVLAERVSGYFNLNTPSPYMLMVAPVDEHRRLDVSDEQTQLFGIEKLNVPRQQIPAVTHADYPARLQTVHAETNPRYHKLITAFDALCRCPLLVNTSFNVRGEPIVCTPEDAYRCFMRTEMDYLVLENFIMAKPEQPPWEQTDDWKQEFELD